MNKQLILITPTWERENRMSYLERLASVVKPVSDMTWLVVEDGAVPSEEVSDLLGSTQIEHRYWAVGPTRDKGHVQRNAALEYIKSSGLQGVVYNADDDNRYDPRLFDQLRQVQRVGVFPVGNLGPSGVERPIIREGRLVGWDAGWLDRKDPIDMAGFAFCASLLQGLQSPLWRHHGIGGESEFLDKLIASDNELEFLCDECTSCFVWHNDSIL